MKNLIFVCTGIDIKSIFYSKEYIDWCSSKNLSLSDNFYYENFNVNNHNTNYTVISNVYNDLQPDTCEYNILRRQKGYKWEVIKYFLNNDYDNFKNIDYIGFLDHDLIINKYDLHNSFEFANKEGIKNYQISLTRNSDIHFQILANKEDVLYEKTNLLESMCPIIHSSEINNLKEFFNYYDIKHGWGIDFIFEQIFDNPLYVLHNFKIYHPKIGSSYNIDSAHKEFYNCVRNIGPDFLSKKGITWKWDNKIKSYLRKKIDNTLDNNLEEYIINPFNDYAINI